MICPTQKVVRAFTNGPQLEEAVKQLNVEDYKVVVGYTTGNYTILIAEYVGDD